MRWPRENRERYVFLRASVNPEWLADDIRMVSQHRPVVITLEPLDAESTAETRERYDSVDAVASNAETWVTDPIAMNAVSRSEDKNPMTALLGQALIRGGRGVSSGEAVRTLVDLTQDGFEAAGTLVEDRTRATLVALEADLNSEQSGRFTRMLRAVWEGHGGSAGGFPSAEALGGLNAGDLTYLVMTLQDADLSFWRRIGKSLSARQIGDLEVDDTLASFQALVTANLDRLTVKGARILRRQPSLFESEESFRWVKEGRCLGLKGPDFVALMAGHKSAELPSADEWELPSRAELAKRLRMVQAASISRVDLERPDGAQASFESSDFGNVVDDPKVQGSVTAWGSDSVRSAMLRLPGARPVNLDFGGLTATAPTSSYVDARDLLTNSIPVMKGISAETMQRMVAFLAHGDDVADQPALPVDPFGGFPSDLDWS